NDWIEVDVKTRYSTKSAKAKIIQEDDKIKVVFDEPQRAITPGQSAVFYIGDYVLGGGKI
nr:tRNA 2-thiouridine(34) synthase MnmA [Clostridia bacterium]